MSTLRGRANVGVATGFTAPGGFARTGGETVGGISTPPAYRPSPGGGQPTSFFDFSQVPAWRLTYVAAALAYLGIFHFTLPGGLASVGRTGGGLPHGHGMAVALYIASWLVVIDAARDVLMYAYPNNPAASALKQSL